MPFGNTDDDNSYDWMFFIGQASRRDNASRWIADNAGLGVIDAIVTSTGDHLVWSE